MFNKSMVELWGFRRATWLNWLPKVVGTTKERRLYPGIGSSRFHYHVTLRLRTLGVVLRKWVLGSFSHLMVWWGRSNFLSAKIVLQERSFLLWDWLALENLGPSLTLVSHFVWLLNDRALKFLSSRSVPFSLILLKNSLVMTKFLFFFIFIFVVSWLINHQIIGSFIVDKPRFCFSLSTKNIIQRITIWILFVERTSAKLLTIFLSFCLGLFLIVLYLRVI